MISRKLRKLCRAQCFVCSFILFVIAVVYFQHIPKDENRRQNSVYHTAAAISRLDNPTNSLEGEHPKWNTESSIGDDPKDTFCEYIDLGCFQVEKSATGTKHEKMTRKWCVLHCNLRDMEYAGITEGTTCVCGRDVNHVVRLQTTSSDCTLPCPGNKKEVCGGESAVIGLFIKGDCVNALPADEANTSLPSLRSKGCSLPPPSDSSFYSFNATSSQQCLFKCERQRQPMAVYNADGVCLCGKMTERFNLTHKLKDCHHPGAVSLFRTWVEDKRCGGIRFLPLGTSGKTQLVSYPGSGNTWTRYLLEKASGFYTGSVHRDRTLHQGGLLGEMVSGRTEFVKDHLFSGKRPNMPRVIVVIRNPYRAVLSYLNYLYSGGFHTGSIPQELFREGKRAITEQSILEPIRHWTSVPRAVVTGKSPYLIMYFEDIVKDPIGSTRKMVQFSRNPAILENDLESRLACLSQDTTGWFKRPKVKFSFNPFKPKVIEMLNEAILEVRQLLKEAGVEKELPPYEFDEDYAVS